MIKGIYRSFKTSSTLAMMVLCITILGTFAGTASAAIPGGTLPDLPGWTGDAIETMILESAEKNEGRMTERSYRKNDGFEVVKVVMLEGPGTVWLSLPKGHAEGEDGPVGTGATYRTLEILGKTAVLEHHPVLGYSLAIRLHPESTLTIETKSEERLLLDFSKSLLELFTE